MKKSLFVLFTIFLCVPVYAEKWEMSEGRMWTRDPNAATLSKDGDVFKIVHTGTNDWTLGAGNRIAVVPGEVFEINIDAAIMEGTGNAEISVVTRNKEGQAITWHYGNKAFLRTGTPQAVSSVFAIPHGITTIEPRILGRGPATVHAARFTAQKTGNIRFAPPGSKFIKENKLLKVEFSDDVFAVTDKRTGRVWNGTTGLEVFGMAYGNDISASNSFDIHQLEQLRSCRVFVALEPDAPEFTIRIEADGPMEGNLQYPPPFVSKRGDRLIIPMNEGISYPVEEQDIGARRLIGYGGHGICMSFWGQIEDATGTGMMTILETPDDVFLDVAPNKSGLLQVAAIWEPSRKEFRYPRQLRYIFLDEGGHVAICKRYRQYAKDTGLFVPFTEKVKRNPNIDKLLGAANIWYRDRDKVELVKEMLNLGMERLLWSSGGTAAEIAEMNKFDNVLTSRYDVYQDIMDPAKFNEVASVHPDWTTEAWPHDINWTSPDGTWRKGWEVSQKDRTKPRIPCAMICDAKAVPYALARITKELETIPYAARFLDTTVAMPWVECYHPDHPMTRSDSKKHKMELLKLIGDLGLVGGNETGHDAAVPYCDYFEGMLSLGNYRIADSGRNTARIVDEVPPQIERFQVNPVFRLPLWELVYHDCVVAQWYWGDYNNKFPAVWRKRDLFNALYGTAPMYMFSRQNWNDNKEKFVESYKTATTTALATAYAEMIDHKILSPDRLVQQTVFCNGVVVTVNFGEAPFRLSDGAILNGFDWKVLAR